MLQWRKQDIAPQVEQEVRFAASKVNDQSSAEQSVSPLFFISDWYVRPAIILTSFALFCGLLFNAATYLWDWLDRPVTRLNIIGNTQYLDRNQMLHKLAENIQPGAALQLGLVSSEVGVTSIGNSVLSLDINEIQKIALEEPWVNSVSLKRNWPGTIAIEVTEQVPVAKWGNKGLLNHQGDIFWPENRQELEHLPRLDGPSTDTARVMDQYHTLSQFFKGSNTLMTGLTLQARGAWTLLLDNKIEVELGREKILTRLRRFLELYKGHLYHQAAKIERVDVRYTNGVAVKWLPVPEQKIN